VTSQTSGAAAEAAVVSGQEDSQVCPIDTGILFITIVVETMGAINSDVIECLDDLGGRITQCH